VFICITFILSWSPLIVIPHSLVLSLRLQLLWSVISHSLFCMSVNPLVTRSSHHPCHSSFFFSFNTREAVRSDYNRTLRLKWTPIQSCHKTFIQPGGVLLETCVPIGSNKMWPASRFTTWFACLYICWNTTSLPSSPRLTFLSPRQQFKLFVWL
jgi:hypothetical protein